MDLQTLVVLILSALLTLYLFYALLQPEKF